LPCSLPGRYRQRISVRCLELSSQEEILGFRRCENAFPAPGLRTMDLMAAAPSWSSRAKAHHLALCHLPGHFERLDESLDSSIRSTDASVPRAPRVLTVSVAPLLSRKRAKLGTRLVRASAGSTEPRRRLRTRHRTLRSPPSSPELTELYGAHATARHGLLRESTEPLAGSLGASELHGTTLLSSTREASLPSHV
jgi:hypothetical protein